MAVVYARLFMSAYPVFSGRSDLDPADQQPVAWASAMTYKFVGALRSLTDDKPYQRTAIWIGIGIGAAVQIARLALRASRAYRSLVAESRVGYAIGFRARCVRLAVAVRPTRRFFLNLSGRPGSGAGGAFSSLYNTWSERRDAAPARRPVASEWSHFSGRGGLIAGDALAALTPRPYRVDTTLLG